MAISLGGVWDLPVKVIPSFSAACLDFPSIPFDRPPQLGAVGPVVYALNKFSPLSSFVIRCRFGDLIIHCRQPGRDPACVGRLALHHG